MDNEEFQKLVPAHFDKLSERLGNIEELSKQHHEDTEKIDMNYLVRKTADHDDALILLKKAK